MFRISRLRCPGLGLFLLLLIALFPFGARAEGFRLLESSEFAIEVECTLPPMKMDTVSVGGSVYTKVDIADSGTGGGEGAPRLPVLRRLLEVPFGAVWSVFVEAPEFREVPLTAPVLPLQPVQYGNDPVPPFVLNAQAYSKAGFSATPLAQLRELGTMRQHRLALLQVDAVQYDPARRVLRVLERARIRIVFQGTAAPMPAAEQERLRSPLFDSVVQRLVLNAPPARYFPGPPVGLLVVSAAEFADDPVLAAFLASKARRGLQVTHVSTAEIGSTTTAIRDYIRNAFWNWAVPPTFVLLVGDTPAIPHWSGIGDPFFPPTDLYYGVMWQEDAYAEYFPDLAVGRLSVDDATQLHNILGKIRSYEEVGWVGNDTWERSAAFMAGLDHAGDHEGELNAVINAFLDPRGYNPDRLYCYTNHATSKQVADAFNEGRALGTYSGHGTEVMWSDGPVFRQSDVRSLTNEVYPLIQSYSCMTGDYTMPECFGETWIRGPHGAVGFFGSSVESATLADVILSWHFYEAAYNAQAEGYPSNQTWMGGMVVYAKLTYAQHMGYEWSRGYLEQYNLLGDPSVDMWTGVPAVIQVEAPQLLVEGPTGLEISTAGSPNLMVTARKQDGQGDFFVVAWTDSTGHADLSFPGPIGPGTLALSVTGHDRAPWYREVPVIPPGKPTLVADTLRVLDLAGDADGQCDAGETFGLTLDLKNIGFEVAVGAWGFLLSSTPPGLEIITGLRSYGDIAPGDTRTNDQPFEVRLPSNVPDQQEMLVNLSVESDNPRLWNLHYHLTARAPTLQVCGDLVDDSPPRGDGDGVADPGETLYLSFWIENTGHAAAGDLAGGLACQDPNAEILDADGRCLGVEVGQRALLGSYKVKILDACPSSSRLALQSVISTPDGELTTLSYDLVVGPWFDDAEVDRGWQLSAPGDDATNGFWERLDPILTLSLAWHGEFVQPGEDHTPGLLNRRCFFTRNPIGQMYPPGDADVDGGRTTLLSPIFDLSDATSAVVGYWRWYTNNLGPNPGQDWWDVEVTSDGETWVSLEHTTESANAWTFFSFNVDAYVPLTDKIQFRFVARDDSFDSLVEAAVDDITLAVTRSLPTGVPGEGAVSCAGFVGVYPNPLGLAGRIVLRQGTRARLQISLFDVAGRLVRRLVDAEADPGLHTLQFDGEDGAGRRLASGVYFLKLETPGVRQYRQVTVLR
jgi:hypothetical protein